MQLVTGKHDTKERTVKETGQKNKMDCLYKTKMQLEPHNQMSAAFIFGFNLICDISSFIIS